MEIRTTNNIIYNIKPLIITIKMKNKIDLYKIKYLNSALKLNVITNTSIDVKPCKLKLWTGSWLVSEEIQKLNFNWIFIILDLNSSENIKRSYTYEEGGWRGSRQKWEKWDVIGHLEGIEPWPDIMLSQRLIYYWQEIFLVTLMSDSEAIL